MSSDRMETIWSESGARPQATGWLSARALSELIAAPLSPARERIGADKPVTASNVSAAGAMRVEESTALYGMSSGEATEQ